MPSWTDVVSLIKGGAVAGTTSEAAILNGTLDVGAGPGEGGPKDMDEAAQVAGALVQLYRGGIPCRTLTEQRAKLFGRRPRGLRDEYGRRLYSRTRLVGLSYAEKKALGLSDEGAANAPLFIRTKCLSTTPPRRNWNSTARRRDALKTIRAMARDAALSRRAANVMARIAGKGQPRAMKAPARVIRIPAAASCACKLPARRK